MTVRQHWIVLVRPAALALFGIAVLMVWMLANPVAVVHGLHLSSATPGIGLVRSFYAHGAVYTALPLIGAMLVTLSAWSWWSISYFELDGYTLSYKLGPFFSNRIPLRSVQDIRVARPLIGICLGYGTLTIDAGLQEQTLNHVPDVDAFLEAMRSQAQAGAL